MKINLKKKIFNINKSKEEVFDIVSNIMFCIILLLVAVFVGSPIKYNFSIVNAVIGIYGIVFILVKKLIFKSFKFVKNKVDVFMLLLLLSSFLSLIFKTYASLNDTVTYIQLYISIYILYIVVANSNKNAISKCIVNCIIASSIMFVIFGIDELTFDYFRPLFDKLQLVDVENIEYRMFSTFGYANSFAIVMAFANLLTLDKYIKSEKNISKILYGSLLFVQLVGLIFSYSKATILVYGLILILYLVLLKDKEKIIKTILVLGVDLILTVIYLRIFTTLKQTTSMESIWYVSGIIYVLSVISVFVLTKIEKYIIKIKIKTMLIITGIVCLLFVIFIIITLNISEPITAFMPNSSNDKLKYGIRSLENNKEYTLVFDIESKIVSDNKNLGTYEIRVIEENKYYDTIQTKKVTFGEYFGTKEIKIHLSEEASGISIEIEPINKENKNGLKINSLHINDKEYILNYKFLPTSIVNKVKEINFSNKSAWERGVFIRDGFKAAIYNNPIVGIGGNAWKYVYPEVQEYAYNTKESHSYITELFIEFGILGVISYTSIIILTVYELVLILKKKQGDSSNIKTIIIAIILLFLHSLIDFDMSFIYIMSTMYISISLIFNDKGDFNSNKLLKNIELFLLIIFSILILISIYFNIMQVVIKINEENTSKKTAMRLMPYNIEYRRNYLNTLNKDIDRNEKVKQICKILENEKYNNNLVYSQELIATVLECDIDENEKIKYIEKVYKILQNEPIIANIYRNNNVVIYTNIISNLLEAREEENIKQWSKKFDQIIVNNYEEYLRRMVEKENNRLEEKEIYQKYQYLQRYL